MSARITWGSAVTGEPGSAVVAAGSRATAEAAAQVLAHGGNAVDAAISAMLAAAMAEPVLTSLGGGGFCLRAPVEGDPDYLDFFVDTPGRNGGDLDTTMTPVTVTFGSADDPQARQVFHAGWGSVAVPGCFAGYLDAHHRWGSLPLPQVVAPALHLARDGVVLDPIQRDFMRLVAGVLAVTPESEHLYAEAMRGGTFVNPGYAALLHHIADGAGMNDPVFADPLVDAMRAFGGRITQDDLAAYRPMSRRGLTMHREGAAIWTNPPPSFGGAIVLEALGALAPEPDIDWARAVTAMRESTQRQRERSRAALAALVSRGTTSVSVIDAEGCMVTCTTSNGSASGTVVDGVQLNNMLGEEDLNPLGAYALPPGVRMGSMMTPTAVTLADGTRVTFGSGGSERIRSAHLSVLLRLIDQGTSLAEAIRAPRVHATPTGVEIEPGVDPMQTQAMRDLGVTRVWPSKDLFFGGVHGVRINPDGSTEAVGDERRGGVAAAVTLD